MSSPLAEAFLLVTLNNCYETPSKEFLFLKIFKKRGAKIVEFLMSLHLFKINS